MLAAAQRRYAGLFSPQEAEVSVDLPTGGVTITVPKGVTVPPQSTIELARILDVKPGERVLELGCGSGLLSIAAAKSGADHVLATDLDPGSLETTRANACRNGIGDALEVSAGSWYEAVPLEEREKGFDVILATPPQTPGHRPFGPKYGGEDGTRHLLHIVEEAPQFLNHENGRLWILAISLANPGRLLQRLGDRFSEVKVLKETDRFFTRDEYEGYAAGLFAHLQSLRNEQRCEFRDAGAGSYVFRNLFICARGPKKKFKMPKI
jgi:methylase of polypeptide subunit release factors